MTLATIAAKSALRMVAKYGRDVQVERVTVAGVYDPATGKTSAPTTQIVTVKAYAKDLVTLVGRAPNVQINAGDQEILIAASGFVKPSLDDTITIGSEKYVIVPLARGGMGISTVVVNATDVLYKIHGRRS